jgi:hypothetical protein
VRRRSVSGDPRSRLPLGPVALPSHAFLTTATAVPSRRVRANARRVTAWTIAGAREHWLFLLLLAAGGALRAITFFAYRPVLFGPDSYWYLSRSVDLKPSVLKPIGYSAFLHLLPLEHELAVVPFVQHLLGLVVAVVIYALLLRLGVPRWLAALASAPVLLDSYQLNIEQYILSESLFDLLLVAACALLLWRQPLGLGAVGLAGLLFAVGGLVRGIGLVVVGPAVLTLLFLRAGLSRALAMLALFALPLVLYAAWFHSVHGVYALSTYEGRFLYGRVAPFADCSKFSVPKRERVLCPETRAGERPTVPELLWGRKLSPINKVHPPPGKTRNEVAGDFARRVIRHQPLSYLHAVARDIGLTFAPTKTARAGEFGVAQWQFQPTYPIFLPPWRGRPIGSECVPGPMNSATEAACNERRQRATRVIRSHGDKGGYADAQLGSFLRTYQRVGYVPGPLLAVFLVVALLAAVGVGRARQSGLRAAAFLFSSGSVVLLLASVAVTVFSWRYELPQLVLLPPAAAIGLTALTATRDTGATPAGTETTARFWRRWRPG